MDKIKINNQECRTDRGEREAEQRWLHVAPYVAAGVAHGECHSVYFIMSTNKCINCNVDANLTPSHHHRQTPHY